MAAPHGANCRLTLAVPAESGPPSCLREYPPPKAEYLIFNMLRPPAGKPAGGQFLRVISSPKVLFKNVIPPIQLLSFAHPSIVLNLANKINHYLRTKLSPLGSKVDTYSIEHISELYPVWKALPAISNRECPLPLYISIRIRRPQAPFRSPSGCILPEHPHGRPRGRGRSRPQVLKPPCGNYCLSQSSSTCQEALQKRKRTSKITSLHFPHKMLYCDYYMLCSAAWPRHGESPVQIRRSLTSTVSGAMLPQARRPSVRRFA